MSGPFSQRLAYLRSVLAGAKHPVVLLETVLVNDEDELMAAFEQFRAQGYEGAMVRNANGLYVNKRSYDLQKVKEFDDAEFRITGVKEGRGKLAGHGIFECQTKEGAPFEAKMIGALAELRKYYEDPRLAVGRLLTVQYQGFTNKSGVPRFPVALRIRD
jgi:ATP-dependent DNA ligase